MGNVTRVAPKTTAVQTLAINPASAGQTALVAAQPGMSIRVLSVAVVAAGAVTVKFQSGSTDITPPFPLGANGGLVLPFNEHGWFQTAENAALNVNLGGAVATAILISYQVL